MRASVQVKALRKNEGNLHLNSAFGAILLTLRGRKVCRGMLDFGKVPTQQVGCEGNGGRFGSRIIENKLSVDR